MKTGQIKYETIRNGQIEWWTHENWKYLKMDNPKWTNKNRQFKWWTINIRDSSDSRQIKWSTIQNGHINWGTNETGQMDKSKSSSWKNFSHTLARLSSVWFVLSETNLFQFWKKIQKNFKIKSKQTIKLNCFPLINDFSNFDVPFCGQNKQTRLRILNFWQKISSNWLRY